MAWSQPEWNKKPGLADVLRTEFGKPHLSQFLSLRLEPLHTSQISRSVYTNPLPGGAGGRALFPSPANGKRALF